MPLRREFSVEGEHRYDRRGPVRWVLSHMLRYKGFLFSFFIASTVTAALFSAVPALTGRAFNEVLKPAPDARQLLFIGLAMLGIVVVRGGMDIVNAFSIETLAQRTERDARQELYISLLGKSQTFHNRQRVGDIMARASNDVRQLNPMLNPGIALLTDSLMSILMPLIFISFIHVQLLAAPLVFLAIFAVLLRDYTRRLNPVAAEIRGRFGDLNAGLNETISGIEVVKAAAQEAQEKRKFARHARLVRDFYVKEGQVQARYLPILFFGFALTAAFAHGLWLVQQNVIDVGQLVAYMGLMGILRFPTFISIFTFSLVQLGIAGARRILEMLDEETEMDENKAGHSADMRGDIVFDQVSFGFGRTRMLDGITFHIRPGQTVAIVGQTGAGKTTLTKLVNRIYDVNAGRILIDGVDVRDWSMAALRSQISTIEQDVFLFSRSIRENIAFGLGNKATEAAIVQAAKDAQAHDFILSFKDGYDTVIGERGVTLSGGQRQRLAIARALLTDPRILILDDSTSAIDSATEDKIQQAIHRVLEGRTTFLITHRLSMIRRADVILMLDKGRVVDSGTHADLMERNALYQRIFARYF
ncbi:MAG: ABC transporter ATP-binding protein [Caldilineaceae bacterium]|nr:ABC transporter ATP-binding protein [Caldilineaceae bacterium]